MTSEEWEVKERNTLAAANLRHDAELAAWVERAGRLRRAGEEALAHLDQLADAYLSPERDVLAEVLRAAVAGDADPLPQHLERYEKIQRRYAEELAQMKAAGCEPCWTFLMEVDDINQRVRAVKERLAATKAAFD